MAWARYDDELSMNKKVGALLDHGAAGVAALGLHLLANTWSRNQGTGGFIPTRRSGLLVGDQRLGRKLAGLLLDVGMFDAAEGGERVHDFDVYSDPKDDGRPAAERKRDRSEVARANGQRGGLAKAGKLPSKANDLLEAPLQQNSGPVPDPVPVPLLAVVGKSSTSRTARDRRSEAIERYAAIGWEQANQSKINDRPAFMASRRQQAAAMPELDRWLHDYPDASGSQIGAWLSGDKHSMRYQTRGAS